MSILDFKAISWKIDIVVNRPYKWKLAIASLAFY